MDIYVRCKKKKSIAPFLDNNVGLAIVKQTHIAVASAFDFRNNVHTLAYSVSCPACGEDSPPYLMGDEGRSRNEMRGSKRSIIHAVRCIDELNCGRTYIKE